MDVFRTFGGKTASTTGTADANKGEMNFAFIDMGQGDCTIISDPDNNVFVIDCGASILSKQKNLDKAKEIVRAWVAAGDDTVDLICTHPDFDHYNKYIDLLLSKPKVDVNAIYFSRAISDKSPLGRYRVTGFNLNLDKMGYPMLTEVTLNANFNYKKVWKAKGGLYSKPAETDIPDSGLVLTSGTVGKKTWSITIIAGNVDTVQTPTSATANNVVSLCTVAKFGDEKAFFTGDATEETLTYLYDNQKDHFKNCSIFQVPHHGSESSIPTNEFKNHVNPQTLLVSVGFAVHTHKLPRNIVLDKWLTCSRLRDVSNTYDEWIYAVKGYKKKSDLDNIIKTKWKKYNVKNTRTFYFLEDPDDGEKSGTGFWGFTTSFYFIYRRKSNQKDIYVTAIYGNLTNQNFGELGGTSNNLLITDNDGH